MTDPLPNLDDIERAAARLAGVANRTPVLTSRALDEEFGAELFLKAENFQRAGAFKFRGAYNAISSLADDDRRRGVATYSSGNHAQAVALAAALHEVPATILMPEDAPVSKVEATRSYGAEVVFYDRYTQERADLGNELAERAGMTLVPPFDDWDVIAGQGTAALELFEDVGRLDLLVVCVGGGGLISGCSTVASAQADPPRVVGVEPAAGDDVKQSLEQGHIVTIPTPRTIADGQQTTAPSDRTFAVIKERVNEVVTVTDEAIVETMRFTFERLKVVLEPSGASALGAIRSGEVDVTGKRVGVTLSGGNVSAERFTSLVG
ncbi:MAG: threo-3-hydroxy-L-aspartate ammonia-lyase [Acidimicrobiales bacterium]